MTPAVLPDDLDALSALMRATVDAYETQVSGLRQQLDTRVLEIERLKLQIAKLQRMQFGAKSEKLDRQIGQLELRLEELQADGAEVVADAPARGQGGKPYQRVGHYRNIYLARITSTSRTASAARTAAGRCTCWAKMSRSNWSTCPATGGCCAIAAPSGHASAAT